MIKKICLTTFIFLIIAMPAYSFAADDELDWGLLDKKKMTKEEIDKFSRKGDVVLPELLEAFKSENMNKKVNVMNILGNMPGENSKREMIGILEALCAQPLSGRKSEGLPEEVYLEQVAMIYIGRADEKSIAILKRDIARDITSAKDETRKCLIIAAGFLKDSTYYDSIVEILETDKNPYLRRLSAMALAKVGNEKTMPILEKVLMNDDFYYSLNEKEAQELSLLSKDGKFYPVREAAALALILLGKTLEQRKIIKPDNAVYNSSHP